ncbi:MAG: hypothetical protein IKK61_10150 [Clostridia bacterium]|nr:hypothetical protein [Clostridia bacterium]
MNTGICHGVQRAETGVYPGVTEKQEAFLLYIPRGDNKKQKAVEGKRQEEICPGCALRQEHHHRHIQQPDRRRYQFAEAGLCKKQRGTDVTQGGVQEKYHLSDGTCHEPAPPVN